MEKQNDKNNSRLVEVDDNRLVEVVDDIIDVDRNSAFQ